MQKKILFGLTIFFLNFLFSSPVNSATGPCTNVNISNLNPQTVPTNYTGNISITLSGQGIKKDARYQVVLNCGTYDPKSNETSTSNEGGPLNLNIPYGNSVRSCLVQNENQNLTLFLRYEGVETCFFENPKLSITPETHGNCRIDLNPQVVDPNANIQATLTSTDVFPENENVSVTIYQGTERISTPFQYSEGTFTYYFLAPPKTGNYIIRVESVIGSGPESIYCENNFQVGLNVPTGATLAPSPGTSTSTNVCGGATPGSEAETACKDCLGCSDPTNPSTCANLGSKSWTALGCVSTDPEGFVGQVLPGAIGVGGGIAFLIMLFGIFTIIMSSGNPEKLNQGKEMIVSAIAGLLMILFSVFLLRVIGVNILRIPGLE